MSRGREEDYNYLRTREKYFHSFVKLASIYLPIGVYQTRQVMQRETQILSLGILDSGSCVSLRLCIKTTELAFQKLAFILCKSKRPTKEYLELALTAGGMCSSVSQWTQVPGNECQARADSPGKGKDDGEKQAPSAPACLPRVPSSQGGRTGARKESLRAARTQTQPLKSLSRDDSGSSLQPAKLAHALTVLFGS